MFSWTESLPNDVCTLEKPDFAFGSIRNVHAHVAGCDLWWVGRFGLNLEWGTPKLDNSRQNRIIVSQSLF